MKKKKKFEEEKAKSQEEKVKGKENIDKLAKEDKETSEKDKKKLCEKTKAKIEEIWDEAAKVYIKSQNERSAVKRGNYSWDAEKYCNYGLLPLAKKSKELIKDNFQSEDDYLTACKYIRENNDCNTFAIDNKGAWYFIKKTLKYANLVRLGGTCIIHLLKIGGKDEASGTPENKDVKTIAEAALSGWEVAKLIFKQTGSFFLHLITFGIWGALKAAWTILKLSLTLYLMVHRFLYDLPFNLGKIVGMALVAIKAFFVGRRRRLRLR